MAANRHYWVGTPTPSHAGAQTSGEELAGCAIFDREPSPPLDDHIAETSPILSNTVRVAGHRQPPSRPREPLRGPQDSRWTSAPQAPRGKPPPLSREPKGAHVSCKEHLHDLPTIPHWPTGPHKLRETTFFSFISTAYDITISLLPVLFLVLCALAAQLDGKPTENNVRGEWVTKAMQLGPTVFPVLFAAVAGRTLKLFATFCAERGAKLGTLELLLASQTVWGTIEAQFYLRRLTFVGVHLFFLWALSPFGGQASLRLLSTAGAVTVSTSPLRYLDTSLWTNRFSGFAGSASQPQIATVNSLYVSTLLSVQTSGQDRRDPWGNVRMPRLEPFLDSNFTADPEGWYTIPEAIPPDSFTSLIGLPIAGPLNGSLGFSVEHSYLSLTCGAPMNVSRTDSAWLHHLGNIWSQQENLSLDGINPFMVKPAYSFEGYQPISFFLDTNTVLSDDARLNAGAGLPLTPAELRDPSLNLTRNILFGSLLPVNDLSGQGSAYFMRSNCSLIQSNIEVGINCTAEGGCKANTVRRSRQNKTPGQFTPFDSEENATNMFQSLPLSTGSQPSGVSSPTEAFLFDSSKSPFAPGAMPTNDFIDLFSLAPAVLATRLGILLNTYYQPSLASTVFTGGLPSNLTLYGPANLNATTFPGLSQNEYDALESSPMTTRQTDALMIHEHTVFETNYAWLALLVACSSILLILGLSGLVVKMKSTAPDMLGYVSSMTHHNPHIRLPSGGGPLDGMERARTLRDVKVRLADVQGAAAVGLVALISSDDQCECGWAGTVRPLERSRRYI